MNPTSSPVPRDVAIVTVSYNSSSQLEEFLSRATRAIARCEDVIVVDNASADVSQAASVVRKFGATLVRLDANVGYGQAANAGVAALPKRCSVVVICNPDSLVSPEAVARLRTTLNAATDIGAVGPRILNEDGTIYPSARAVPSLRTGVGHALFARIWPRNPWTKRYYSDAYRSDTLTDAGWLSGACVMLRRETFTDMGGFDSDYFMYFEDVDLGYRLGKRGLRNVYDPEAVITHIGGATTKSTKRSMLTAHHDSAKKFLSTKYSGAIWAPVRLVLRAGLNLRLKLESRGLE